MSAKFDIHGTNADDVQTQDTTNIQRRLFDKKYVSQASKASN